MKKVVYSIRDAIVSIDDGTHTGFLTDYHFIVSTCSNNNITVLVSNVNGSKLSYYYQASLKAADHWSGCYIHQVDWSDVLPTLNSKHPTIKWGNSSIIGHGDEVWSCSYHDVLSIHKQYITIPRYFTNQPGEFLSIDQIKPGSIVLSTCGEFIGFESDSKIKTEYFLRRPYKALFEALTEGGPNKYFGFIHFNKGIYYFVKGFIGIKGRPTTFKDYKDVNLPVGGVVVMESRDKNIVEGDIIVSIMESKDKTINIGTQMGQLSPSLMISRLPANSKFAIKYIRDGVVHIYHTKNSIVEKIDNSNFIL